MNDLDLVRQMRADAPETPTARLAHGRERLRAAIGSPDAAPARSRRRPPRRPMLIAGGLAVAAAAAAIVVTTQVDQRPVTLHTSPAAQRYDDPLVERGAFGWLPNGLHTNGWTADHQGHGYFQIIAQQAGNGRASVTLTAYTAGHEPELGYLPGGVPARRIPAPAVNGHSAYWIFKPDASGQSSFELRWQYAPKSWVDLRGDGLKGSDAALTTMAYKIASSAKFGDDRPIAMPLHIGGMPGGMSPKRTVLNNGAHGQVSAIVDYIVKMPGDDVFVGIDKISGRPRVPAPNGTLDGHPAYRRNGELFVYGVEGFDVQITASGSLLAKLNKTGGLDGFFRNIKILGTDPANWTTHPIN